MSRGGKDLAVRTKKVLAFLSGYFGPYPFESVGGIFTGQSSTDMDLETATRPVYRRNNRQCGH